MKRIGEKGFTLIELMIVIAIIALVAAIAVPNLLQSKQVTNEKTVTANMRSLHSAQTVLHERAVVDADADDIGEYGNFSVLFLSNQLNMSPDAAGVCEKAGYFYKVFLPSVDGGLGTDDDEVEYCAVAWPKKTQKTGVRAFFVDERGSVYYHPNIAPDFDGAGDPPVLADIYGTAFDPTTILPGWQVDR